MTTIIAMGVIVMMQRTVPSVTSLLTTTMPDREPTNQCLVPAAPPCCRRLGIHETVETLATHVVEDGASTTAVEGVAATLATEAVVAPTTIVSGRQSGTQCKLPRPPTYKPRLPLLLLFLSSNRLRQVRFRPAPARPPRRLLPSLLSHTTAPPLPGLHSDPTPHLRPRRPTL